MYRSEVETSIGGAPRHHSLQKLEDAPKTQSRLQHALRRTLDIVLASVFVLSFFWLFLVVWLGVRVTTGSPALYSHKRVGKAGREFGCLKFRSMVVDSDRRLQQLLESSPAARAEWTETFKLRNDPRITPFGRFIRRTSLDELPQFFNVIRGHMSLVGPRPVTRQELDLHYGPEARHYASVKPGITGLWQVSGRSELAYSQRVRHDVDYVQTRTIRLDLWILCRTVAVVLGRQGSH
ncbi:sugar transferase [Ramlibacter sp. Leaf400]|uniref:sugar transferase n=1 Tax=Ramlibacter sp. Leaf400 TaxID=1736365 RepID=UPI0009E7DFE3|nr:sugar transferase [Ramlibacter sp. Leaf400]